MFIRSLMYLTHLNLACAISAKAPKYFSHFNSTCIHPQQQHWPLKWCPGAWTHSRRLALGSRNSPPRSGQTGSLAATAAAPGWRYRSLFGSRCGQHLCCAPPPTWRAAVENQTQLPVLPSQPASGKNHYRLLSEPSNRLDTVPGARTLDLENIWNLEM